MGHIVDEKDFEILKILDKNCRISYSKIAEKIPTKFSITRN